MEKLLTRILQEVRERSCRLPYESSDLAERVRLAVDLFGFTGLPESEVEQAFLDAEKATLGKRPLNLGDVISAWLVKLPESEIDDSRLIG